MFAKYVRIKNKNVCIITCALTHLIFITAHFTIITAHFTDKETEAQEVSLSFPRQKISFLIANECQSRESKL